MMLEQTRNLLTSHLKTHLQHGLPRHPIGEVYRYAVLPPGKLFRGLLVMGMARDHNVDEKELENPWSSHSLLASFVEIHHAYTLVHDDLPCMDDDDMRRGRSSLHKRFGQWRAILVGDGLMGLGYHLISLMESPRQRELLRFVSWATGPQGFDFRGRFWIFRKIRRGEWRRSREPIRSRRRDLSSVPWPVAHFS